MKLHRVVMRASSAELSIVSENGVSVTPNVPEGVPTVTGVEWIDVPQADKPPASAREAGVTVDALQVGCAEASSFTTMEVGTPGVSVLLTRSLRAESETSPFGVTKQEQQDTSCSSGEKA